MRDARPDDHRRALRALEEYVALQRKLVAGWLDHIGVVPDQFLLNVPRSGELDVDGACWRFQRHGVGVRFTEELSGVMVDIEERLDMPDLFSAWRLRWHFGSMKRRGVKLLERVTGDCGSTLEARIERWLEGLEQQGVVIREDGWWHLSLAA